MDDEEHATFEEFLIFTLGSRVECKFQGLAVLQHYLNINIIFRNDANDSTWL